MVIIPSHGRRRPLISARRRRRRRGTASIFREHLVRLAFRYRPDVEIMEQRALLSTLSVTTTNDSGPGSLRQAILDADTASDRDVITFTLPGAGVHTIALASKLPDVTESVLIDGFSQLGYSGAPLIEVRGPAANPQGLLVNGTDIEPVGVAAISSGLEITGSNVEVRGLRIDGFSTGPAILITGPGASNDWIHGNVLGADSSSNLSLPNANGVLITAGAHDNIIGSNADGQNDAQEGNVISGSSGSGVVVESGNPDDSGGFAQGETQNPLLINGRAQIVGDRLQLTSPQFNGGVFSYDQAGSAFTVHPVAISAFTSSFQFQLTDGNADGFTFTIQGAGSGALGASGGALGFGSASGSPSINQSVAVKFDLFDNAGEGNDSTGLYLDGAQPTSAGSIDLRSTGIDLHSGDIFNVALAYDGTSLAVTITDTQTGATASQSYHVDIPGTVGGATAYVGFTAGTSGQAATQDILNFRYSAPAGDPVNNRILGNSISDTGNATPSPASALHFNGSNFVTLPNDLLATLGYNQTIEGWFQTTSGGVMLARQNTDPTTSENNPDTSYPSIYVGTDGRLYASVGINPGSLGIPLYLDANVADGAWHHVALVSYLINEYPHWDFYLDGALIATQSGIYPVYDGSPPPDASFNQIGTGYTYYWPFTNGGWFGFRGLIDDVRIWNVARTSAELQSDFSHGLEGNEPGLEADYRFDDGGGTTARDSSPNHKDGSLRSQSGDGPAWVASAPQAIDLGGDGVNDPTQAPGEGPNHLTNYPVIASSSNGRTVGWLRGTPGTPYRLEFFASAGSPATQAAFAEVFLEAIAVTTDNSGLATFDVPYTPIPGKPVISATATDPAGNTSEVSIPRRPVSPIVATNEIHRSVAESITFSGAAGTGLTLIDPDADPLPRVSLDLSVSTGALSLASTTNLSGTGNGSAVLHYVGTAADLNTSLEGMRFDPPASYQGLVRLSISVQVADQPLMTAEVDLTFGSYFVTTTADSGPGSLRQAILDANNEPGVNTIAFAIAGGGPQTISLLAPLPPITDSVLLDGFSQPGYAHSPLVELSGNSLTSGDGLTIAAPGVTVRGLAVAGFATGAGIVIASPAATDDWVEANWIGIDRDQNPAGNGVGIRVVSGAHENTIGGTTLGATNTIACNLGSGITIDDGDSIGNRTVGNSIHDNGRVTPTPASKLQFDGTNEVSISGDLLTQFAQAETVEAWFQTSATGVILGSESSNAYFTPTLYVGFDGKLYAVFPGFNAISSRASVNDGRWHHVGVVLDSVGQSLTLYLDDHVESSLSAPPPYSTNLLFDRIGAGFTTYLDPYAAYFDWFGFKGQIDDVRIWSVARSAAEVAADSTGPLSGSEPGLEAYYRFDEGSGTTVFDATANHRDGGLETRSASLPLWIARVGQPIDLGSDGSTLNALAPRQGPNQLQNYPVLIQTVDDRERGWLSGSLPDTPYRIEFFASALASQAQEYLGFLEVRTDGVGQAAFDVPFTVTADRPILTATATDPAGNTSEISQPRRPITLDVPRTRFHQRDVGPITLSASSGTAIVVNDPDGDPLPLEELTISVSAGSLILSGTHGLIGTGNTTRSLHYFGSAAALTAALDGMRFDPPAGFDGLATVSLGVQAPGQPEMSITLNLAYGPYFVTTTDDSGPGSFRQAILDANDSPGPDTIAFAIPGAGVQTIALASPLPTITDSVLIDGFSQPGYSSSPIIELVGQSAGSGDGLAITAPSVTVRGLAVDGFASGAAISISGPMATGDLVESNVIGRHPADGASRSNGYGIVLRGGAHDNTIGGTSVDAGNTITGSSSAAVVVEDDGTVNNPILGNAIFGNGAGTPSPESKLEFDGTSYVSMPNNLLTTLRAAETIEAWFRTESAGVIVGYQAADPATSADWGWTPLNVGTDGRLYGSFDGFAPLNSSGIVNDGLWHHAALVVDGQAQNLSLFLDGSLVGTTSGMPYISYQTFNQIGTGISVLDSTSGPEDVWFGFQGQIDEVRIWSVARTAQELADTGAKPLQGDEPGLAAYYRFDERASATAFDATPNHRDATLASTSSNLPRWVGPTARSIDLGNDDLTPNGPTPRTGPNHFQNHPVILSTSDGRIIGWLTGSLPDSTFRIEIFASPELGQAEDYLGSIDVRTDAAGEAIFAVPFAPPTGFTMISATATDSAGNTSEVFERRAVSLDSPAGYLYFAPATSLTFSLLAGDGLVLHDPEAAQLDPAWDVSLAVSPGAGRLTLAGIAGLSGDGNGTASLRYHGGLNELNAALNGLRFAPAPQFHGKATLTLAASSPGTLGSTVQITITDGVYSVVTTADSGAGSLRQAILDANLTSGPSIIAFAIPGAGVQTIAPGSSLPAITGSVLIDGTTQPGYAGTPIVEISGSAAALPAGLQITGSGSTIRGLAIDNIVGGAGILIAGPSATGNTIESNWIGLSPAAGESLGNFVGIRLSGGAHDNTIGGTTGGGGNSIVFGAGSGVVIADDGTAGNSVLGNQITRANDAPATGLIFNGNGGHVLVPDDPALSFSASQDFSVTVRVDIVSLPTDWSVIIAKARNSGYWYGILISPDGNWSLGGEYEATGTPVTVGPHDLALVQDAIAGTRTLFVDGLAVASAPKADANSADDLWIGGDLYAPYDFRGVIESAQVWSIALSATRIESTDFSILTGTEAGLEADYRFDERSGTTAHDASPHHHDGTLDSGGGSLPAWLTPEPIDLGDDGLSRNAKSPRQGPNNLENYPILFLTPDGHLQGWLSGAQVSARYQIEVFAGSAVGPGGSGVAETFLGSLEVSTDASGQAIFAIPFASPPGQPWIAATATDAQGNTSEVSPTRRVGVSGLEPEERSVTGGPFTFSTATGSGIALVDAEELPESSSAELTLSVTQGSLTLARTQGLSGSGNGSGDLHYFGTIAALNLALDGLRFNPPSAIGSAVTLTVGVQIPGLEAPQVTTSNIYSGAWMVTNTNDSGPGSLRWAIEKANAEPGPNEIAFAVAGAGVQTIAPLSPLPDVTDAVLIDGTTQPGYSGSPLIEISGKLEGIGGGFTITGSGSTIRGLTIDSFAYGPAIHIASPGATGNQIQSNQIGTSPTAAQARPSQVGVQIDAGASFNTIGGTTPGAGNLIAYHAGSGIVVAGDDSASNAIIGNRIADLGNASPAILNFDGSVDHVQLPSFSLGGSLTLEAWVRADKISPGGATIFDFGDRQSATEISLYIDGSSGQMFFGVNGYTYYYSSYPYWWTISTAQAFPTGQWVHVAAVLDSSGNARIYWNGQPAPIGYGDTTLYQGLIGVPPVSSRAIQYLGESTTSSSSPFIGAMTGVKIWSGARTADQVLEDMSFATPVATADLLAYYQLDDGQGSIAHDSSGSGQSGTIITTGSPPKWNGDGGRTAQAIDLGGDGITHSSGTAVQGPNHLQSTPTIVETADGHYHGWLSSSQPNATYRVELFASASFALDGSGNAETLLGALEVRTDASGQGAFDVPFTPPVGRPFITATATDPSGNTSELSGLRFLSVHLPQSYVAYNVSSRVVVASSGITLALKDQAAGPIDAAWDLSLSVSSGTLTLPNVGGLVGSGNGTASLEYRGGFLELSAALQRLTFTPAAGSTGNVAMTVNARSYGAQAFQGQLTFASGHFVVTSTADAGPGSLRQAIVDAIHTPVASTIRFAIPGAGVQTILIASPLPTLPASLLIDGTTQPGYAGTPLVELFGINAGDGDGLTIIRSGITIRGLAIDGFASGAGILISGPAATGNTIAANYIGTDPTAANARQNGTGITIEGNARDNTIGGSTAQAGNLIIDNAGAGIVVLDSGSVGNRLLGNRVFDNSQAQQSGVSFDGSGGYLELPSFPIGGEFTFEAWVKAANVYATWARIFDFGDGPGLNDMNLAWNAQTGTLGFGFQDANQNWSGTTLTGVFPQDDWVHVAVTVDDEGHSVLYWNDVSVATGTVSALPVLSRAHMYVVRSNWSADAAFAGSIDEVKIWSVARTPFQIRSDMTTVPTGLEPGLAAYYKLDEADGLIAHDASTSGRDALLTTFGDNNPAWNPSAAQEIDLGGDGPTANDVKPRLGPNDLENAPIIVSTPSGLAGWLGGGLPNSRYIIQVFAGQGLGTAQAEIFLGSIDVVTDSAGGAKFTIPFRAPDGYRAITATATDPSGNTSELSSLQRDYSVESPTSPVQPSAIGGVKFAAATHKAIILHDPESGPLDPTWSLSISVGSGVIRLADTAGLTGTGDGSSTVQYRGGLNELNAALDGLRYLPPAGFHGQIVIQITAGPDGQRPLQRQVIVADGLFSVTTTADSGEGSLRQALLDAASIGSATTTFNISGSGVHIIAPVAPLPSITGAVLIDGFSQPGYAGSPLIVLDGSSSAPSDGLTMLGSGAIVRGLAIGGFSGTAIAIAGPAASHNEIVANEIGISPTGDFGRALEYGVRITGGAHDNTVGGADGDLGNVITGYTEAGVSVTGKDSLGNRVTANQIHGNDNPVLTPSPSGALQLDGSSYVNLTLGLFEGNRFHQTLEAWFQTTAGGVILGNQSTTPGNYPSNGWTPILYVGTDGKLYGGSWNGYLTQVTSQTTVNDGKWHSVALSVDSDARIETLYLDGQLVGTVAGDFLFLGGVYNQIGIGYTQGWPATPQNWYGFQGRIDDVRVWGVVRSPSQIQQDSLAAPSVSDPHLAAYYPLDDASGLTAGDASAQHSDGTLTGMDGHVAGWSTKPLPVVLGSAAGTSSADEVANRGELAPVLVMGADGVLRGRLENRPAGESFRIDVFASADYAPDGSGQAQRYLGSVDVATDASGQATFVIPFAPPADLPVITATATDSAGNTSEVSGNRRVTLTIPTRATPPAVNTGFVLSNATGGALAIEDPSAGALASLVSWDLTLTVTAGSLALSETAGLSGSGNGTDSLHYHGTIQAINAALDGLRYTRPTGFDGLATVGVHAQAPGVQSLSGQLFIAFYQVTSTADAGPGTLRQALLDASAKPGLVVIEFDIPGGGVQTISPLTPLPAIVDSILLDGFTQPGYVGKPLVVLDGQNLSSGDGLSINGAGATVRGLSLVGFDSGSAILISGNSALGNAIHANYLGVAPDGSTDKRNQTAVRISNGAHDNVIGGTDPGDGNTIATVAAGVSIVGEGSLGNRISSNQFVSASPDDQGLTFDGSGAYVQLPSFALGGAVTIETWIRSDNVYASWARIFDFGDGPGVNDMNMAWNGTSGILGFGFQDANQNWTGVGSSTVFPQHEWVHVALTIGAGSAVLYFDGAPVGTSSVADLPVLSRAHMYIVRSNWTTDAAFTGAMRDFEIWGAARTSDQIEADMTTPPTGSEPDLLAFYNFEDGSGLVAHDASLAQRDAALASTVGALPAWSAMAIDLDQNPALNQSHGGQTGPNRLQPAPVVFTGADGQSYGWLGDSVPKSPYRIEFFASEQVGAADVFLGSIDVMTDATGQASFKIPFTASQADPVLSATATDPAGNTSQLSGLRDARLAVPSGKLPSISGSSLTFSSATQTAISLADPSTGALPCSWEIRVSASDGAIFLDGAQGSSGTGEGTGEIDYRGTVESLNAALDGLRLKVPAGFAGELAVNVEARSNGAPVLRGRIVLNLVEVTTTGDNGPGSLWQAINDATSSVWPTVVAFAIPGNGAHAIAPATALPALVGTILLDGWSQAGFANSPLVSISSPADGSSQGLTIAGGNVIVRGLSVDGFGAAGPNPSSLVLEAGGQSATGSTTPGGHVDSERLNLSADGLLIAVLNSNHRPAKLALLDSQHRLLVESDGDFQTGGGRIEQHLAAGTYWLQVTTADNAAPYTLTTTFTASSRPFVPVTLGSNPRIGWPFAFTTGDFNGDEIADLAAYDGIHLGLGDGTFRQPVAGLGLALADYAPTGMITGDWNGDGRLDLAIANTNAASQSFITVLLGKGDGTFGIPMQFYTIGVSYALVAGDFNGDGKLDLAIGGADKYDLASFADNSATDISVLLGYGDGTFAPVKWYPIGGHVNSLIAADFNGDGVLDLATSYSDYNTLHGVYGLSGNLYDVSLLLGKGDGTFRDEQKLSVGSYALAVVAADFNGDGKLELAVGNDGDLSVLPGNGDGTFGPEIRDVGVGTAFSAAAGDFDGDGRIDLAVGGYVLLGNGDGTFQPRKKFAAGDYELMAADFNGDGRSDLAVNSFSTEGNGLRWNFSNDITVLVGKGDGSFEEPDRYAAGSSPVSWTTADFNVDGRLDLATVNNLSNDISVLLGNGDGTLESQLRFAVGSAPLALVSADFNGDGRADIAVVNSGSNDISVLLGKGDGTFDDQLRYAVGTSPSYLIAADFDGDGRIDLAAVNSGSNDVSVLLGNGDGGFRAWRRLSTAGADMTGLAATDVDGDGVLDLTTNKQVFFGYGDGTFQPPEPLGAHSSPSPALDLNNDGRPDRVTIDSISDSVSVSLGNGDGTFVSANLLALAPYTTPIVGDWNGDGAPDAFEIGSSGEILYRQARPSQPGTFDPPVTVDTGSHAISVAFVDTSEGPMLAAVEEGQDVVVLYRNEGGRFVRGATLATGHLPAQIVAGDLNNDGWNDLVVRNAGDGSLSIFLSTVFDRSTFFGPVNPGFHPVSFVPAATLPVGLGISDVTLADTTGRGFLDIIVTNKATGQLTVLPNLGNGGFGTARRYRAGTGLSGMDASGGASIVTSLEATAGAAAVRLTHGGAISLIALDSGSKTLSMLGGEGGGQFANPVNLQTASTARVVQAADFNRDGVSDLAILNDSGLSIMLGDAHGGFDAPVTYDVEPGAKGLSIADVNLDHSLDVLVGNPFGDILVLLGKSDGTFQPFRKTDQAVTLAVADLDGNGTPDFVFANQGLDRVTIDYNDRQKSVLADRSSGLVAPGAVKLTDVNGDGKSDLIVANSGSNSVYIYPGLGNGQFGAALNGGHGFFAGTNPTGVTIADVNGDGKLDLLVANTGSNDVSVLLGQGTGTSWTLAPGPRIKTAAGPISSVVADFNGDGRPDLAVANQQANDVQIFPGVGSGFFNDQSPITIPVGRSPGSIFYGNLAGSSAPELLTVNAGSNDLTLIANFNEPDPIITTIASGGTDPVAAFAFATATGYDDVVVGNHDDGVLALFEGGPDGLVLVSTETDPNLPSPSDLAFATLTSGEVQFYAATEGRESAELVSLTLNALPPDVTVPPPPGSPPATPTFVSLEESSLALVATVLTLSVTPSEAESLILGAEGEAVAIVSVLTMPGVTLGQGQRFGDVELEEDAADESLAPVKNVAGAPQKITGWERFILGLDNALELFREEHRGRLITPALKKGELESKEPEPARSPRAEEVPSSEKRPTEAGALNATDPSDNAGQTSTNSGAVDAAIESIWDENGDAAPAREAEVKRNLTSGRSRIVSVGLPVGLATVVATSALFARLHWKRRRTETVPTAKLPRRDRGAAS